MKLRKIYSTSIFISSLVILSGLTPGCKKAIEVGPSLVAGNSSNVFLTNNSAQAVVSGVYTRLSTGSFFQGTSSISLNMGLAADELMNISSASSSYGTFYQNTYNPLSPPPFWSEFYKVLFSCNTAINGISGSSTIDAGVKKQLIGELKFLRAYTYFYAVNLYGTPPLTTSDDYTVNGNLANSAADDTYKQILQDLTDAQAALSDNVYVDASGAAVTDRVRPNKQVASAMLARVYLYLQDWKNAEIQASAIINNSNYLLVPNLNQVFLKGSKETIWALQPVSQLYLNTIDAYYLVVNASYAATTQLPLNTNNLVKAFETGDARLTNWTGTYTTTTAPVTTYYYAYKYKVASLSSTIAVTEYPIAMRLAEQYLIRAEARAQQNNLTGAAADLNAIRTRAGLANTTASTQANLLNAILHERQVELFSEWGHRWFDLKRSNKLDAVMNVVAPQKGGSWASFKQLMPVPSNDIRADANLQQNPGYN
ncbi:RagB/SusD family nutrient uptake outer membrane protein [Mucilaginibacter sabulilitoris]|uniref:RagB/SusD family nutrient uptake outer membrane protein n=1 Tax=Mucilaginibacter sabulilitoris TaxID=1173583 RepID=A0ABZ0TQJ4_9SPHI|nr:RagB/SusD family nutrient uptake outer membrane protein [Mucilaginibacter sabulilitoris]WPU94732.1 RagB/SusD family nutrient uptake outer membrane protein [Mucilaginibacter sabulilitoris]